VTHSPRLPLKLVLAGGAFAAFSTVQSYGFAELARGAVTLNTTLSGTYDSYFIGSRDNGDDFYFTLRPDLQYSRKAGLSSIDGDLGVSMNRYDKNSQFNSEDLNANFRASLPVEAGARVSGGLSAGYTEGRVVDPLVNDRVSTKTTSLNFNASYELGLKMSLADSLSFSNSGRATYSDQRTLNNSFSYTYSNFLEETSLTLSHEYMRTTSSGDNILSVGLDEHSNAVNLGLSHPIVGALIGSVSYGYRILDYSAQQSLNGSTRSEGSTFSANLTGPLLPPSRFQKLQSSASISYQQANSPGLGDVGGKSLTGNINLSWNARERTKVTLGASRSQDLSPNDFTVVNSQVNAAVTEDIGYFTHLTGSLGYSWRKYRGVDRRDATFSGTLSASYSITRSWSASANYQYQNNEAEGDNSTFVPRTGGQNQPLSSQVQLFGVGNYHRHVISLSLSYQF
jgi:hypothetical protein